jgi:TRAP-type C4-dicarboxylate transport system permease small subunit
MGMKTGLRKLLLVLAAGVIAAAVTYYPWTLMDKFTGAASSVYGMSSLMWAPAALFIGLVLGFCFALALWPRKPKKTSADSDSERHSSLQA